MKNEMLNTRISSELKSKLADRAKRENISVSALVNKALEDMVNAGINTTIIPNGDILSQDIVRLNNIISNAEGNPSYLQEISYELSLLNKHLIAIYMKNREY